MAQGHRGLWLSPVLLLLSLPGCFCTRSPRSVRVAEGGSLEVQCPYSPRWESHGKLWCRGAHWDTCRVLVQTSGDSEHQAQGERVAIRDEPGAHAFTVTMRQLQLNDADTYWCGIRKAGSDGGVRITVTVDPVATHIPKHNRRLHSTATDSPRATTSGVSTRTHYLLLGFLKVPILLLLLGAVLWMKAPRGTPQEQCEEPLYMNV
ncbi:CMRF35-like molecule 7 [Sorex fumeus]|uniref:CMRF35-like molecule 7 n=1 Tax=Sorex fumeus TaxID=62283 RepID=UPI0024AC9F02|nr:CMRF35-like molecule 7 [Sorex fumeus]